MRCPAIAGCEINDHPFHPICARCSALVRPSTATTSPIRWIAARGPLRGEARHARHERGGPDRRRRPDQGGRGPLPRRRAHDPLRHDPAHQPRHRRDQRAARPARSASRSSLFNILEERDVQIRGYRIRLPLDLLLVATANPDDYTHRGRIVSPLKDRFGTQVRTHYPRDRRARRSASWIRRPRSAAGGVPVRVPAFMKEIVAALTRSSGVRRT